MAKLGSNEQYSQGSNDDTESGSSYNSAILINECKNWPNIMECYSDPQHVPPPDLNLPNQGGNYYISIQEKLWDSLVHPMNINLSFAANNTSFMEPLHYRDLLFCTSLVKYLNI